MRPFNLSIPTPCHESWDQMTPTEQGRFCASCQKQVIDFTTMTDQQLTAFFKKSTGNLCGRFAKDQLERDIVMPAKRIPWVRYFFQFTIPAFLLSLKANAQKEVRPGKDQVAYAVGDTTLTPVTQEAKSNVISGKVLDNRGNPIPFASIMIKGTSRGASCNADGKFSLSYQHMPFVITISSVGFQSMEYRVNDTTSNEIVLPALQQELMGDIVVVGYVRRSGKAIPLINSSNRDTAFNKFKVYPNPARSNGTITLDCKKMAKGDYTLEVLAIDGRPVCTRQLVLEQKGGMLRTDLPTLIPGQYLITLMSQASKKLYTEKIQVL